MWAMSRLASSSKPYILQLPQNRANNDCVVFWKQRVLVMTVACAPQNAVKALASQCGAGHRNEIMHRELFVQ